MQLSFESSPVFASPERWFTLWRWGAAAPGVLRVMLLLCPLRAFWFGFLLVELFDEDELPMRSFIMSETSSASA